MKMKFHVVIFIALASCSGPQLKQREPDFGTLPEGKLMPYAIYPGNEISAMSNRTVEECLSFSKLDLDGASYTEEPPCILQRIDIPQNGRVLSLYLAYSSELFSRTSTWPRHAILKGKVLSARIRPLHANAN